MGKTSPAPRTQQAVYEGWFVCLVVIICFLPRYCRLAIPLALRVTTLVI
jgi:hypothetical protein